MDNSKQYIIREAEKVIENYISSLEKKTPQSDEKLKKLQKKYKKSLKLNYFLGFATVISIILSLV